MWSSCDQWHKLVGKSFIMWSCDGHFILSSIKSNEIKSHILTKVDMNWYRIGCDFRIFQKNTRYFGWIWEHHYIRAKFKIFKCLICIFIRNKTFINFTHNQILISPPQKEKQSFKELKIIKQYISISFK